jgi:AAA15 family ATPase/GTPase
MFDKLNIQNFKSIKDLKLNCKRVNIFIGKPNTGKTNILEAIGLLGLNQHPFTSSIASLKEFIRHETINNVFYDENIDQGIKITLGVYSFFLRYDKQGFSGGISDVSSPVATPIMTFKTNYNDITQASLTAMTNIRYYHYRESAKYDVKECDYLLPVTGNNLVFLLTVNKNLRLLAADLFKEFGFRLVLEPQVNQIKIQKEVDDIIFTYPYILVSDTLRRLIFHMAAIETNKNSVIVFDEPEAFAFPYYVKYIAERVGLDNSNQYFIATHNPYFLSSIIEKTKKDDLAVFITYFQDYQTKIREVKDMEMSDIFDMSQNKDIFLNLEKYINKK